MDYILEVLVTDGGTIKINRLFIERETSKQIVLVDSINSGFRKIIRSNDFRRVEQGTRGLYTFVKSGEVNVAINILQNYLETRLDKANAEVKFLNRTIKNLIKGKEELLDDMSIL